LIALSPRAGGPSPGYQADLHAVLRSATDASHQRLHRHRGFAALHDSTISRADYVRLLGRLHGFYTAFEAAAAIAPDRSRRLAADLAALAGCGAHAAALIPRCPDIPAFHDADEILGGLYVVEGAALGGRILARRLDPLLGIDAAAGRSFFLGNGADTGAAWRGYLARLAGISPDAGTRQRVVTAAIATFAAFETWLHDWNHNDDRGPADA
jgi:heme oxygenase (biliverdin-IX-beta and delta-forming)